MEHRAHSEDEQSGQKTCSHAPKIIFHSRSPTVLQLHCCPPHSLRMIAVRGPNLRPFANLAKRLIYNSMRNENIGGLGASGGKSGGSQAVGGGYQPQTL